MSRDGNTKHHVRQERVLRNSFVIANYSALFPFDRSYNKEDDKQTEISMASLTQIRAMPLPDTHSILNFEKEPLELVSTSLAQREQVHLKP